MRPLTFLERSVLYLVLTSGILLVGWLALFLCPAPPPIPLEPLASRAPTVPPSPPAKAVPEVTHPPVPVVLDLPGWFPSVLAGSRQVSTDTPANSDGPLPTGAIARLGTLRYRHLRGVTSVAFSPDGHKVASGGDDGCIRLWNRTTGKELFTSSPQPSPPRALAFSPDSTVLAGLGTAGSIRLWDVTSGKERPPLYHGRELFNRLTFPRDGNTLWSAGSSNVVRLWNLRPRRHLRDLELAPSPSENGIAVSPDRKLLAVANWDKDIRISLRKLDTGEELRQLSGVVTGYSAPAFSPDATRLAAVRLDGSVCVWDTLTGQQMQILRGPYDPQSSLAFSPDGRLLAAPSEQTIHLWDLARGRISQRLSGHLGAVTAIDWSPDGKELVSGSADQTVRFWDAATGQELHPSTGHAGRVTALAFTANGNKLVSAGTDHRLRFWDLLSGAQLGELDDSHHHNICLLAFAPKSAMMISRSLDGTVRLWDFQARKSISLLRRKKDRVLSVAFSPDGKVLALGSNNGCIRFRELNTGTEVVLPEAHPGEVRALAFAPDGKLLGSGGCHALCRWLLPAGKRHLQVPISPPRVDQAAFTPDGQFLLARLDDSSVQLWSADSGEKGHQFRLVQDNKGPIIDLSPEAAELATERRAVADRDTIISFALSPDGRTLALAHSQGAVSLWELATGGERHRFLGHQGEVGCLAFSADGKKLASAGTDGTILVWEVIRPTGSSGIAATPPSRERVAALWEDLARLDAAQAYQAMTALVTAPTQALAVFRHHLRPLPAIDPQRLSQLLAQLDNDEFEVREKATADLEQMGEVVDRQLQTALRGEVSVEARHRLERILQARGSSAAVGERLRMVRAIEVLEWVGTPEAQQLLQEIAGGAVNAQPNQEARAALQRLSKRGSGR